MVPKLTLPESLPSLNIIIHGAVKDELPIVAASSLMNKTKTRNKKSYGDIFAEQLGVTLSLTTNTGLSLKHAQPIENGLPFFVY